MNFTTLGSITDIQLGKKLSPKEKTGKNSFSYLRNQNVQWGRIDLSSLATMDFSVLERQKFELRSGDLLVCEGGEPRRCAIWKGELSNCYYQMALHRLRPHDKVADSEFLLYWLQFQALTGTFEDKNAKTTIAHLPVVRLEQLPVPVITVVNQRYIATHLRAQFVAVEDAHKALQEQIDEAVALSAAIYREAFHDIAPIALPPKFENAPQGWRWVKLNDIARLESGHTPSRFRPEWWGGNISWVSLTEIRALDGKWVEATEIKTNAEGVANSSARMLPRGTVCFSRTASVGFVTIMAQPMTTSQDFANWVCREELDPRYLMHALIRSRTELRGLAMGATHKTIYMPMLESFHVCLPDRSTQKAIVEQLDSRLANAAQIQAGIQARLKEVKLLPVRLLTKAFKEI